MKLKSLLFGTFLMLCSFVRAQNEFITVWKPSNTGFIPSQTTSNQINFPGIGNNYTIYWEEVGYPAHNATLSNVTTALNAPLLIDFGTPSNPMANNATYTVKVSQGNGNFSRICFYAPSIIYRGDGHKIINIAQWGDTHWSSMERAFNYCTEMDVTATDIPDLSNVSTLSGMFAGCYNLVGNPSINNWDVSNVTNLSDCFNFASKFNQPVGNWNISNVTDISNLFANAHLFDQPVGSWNTSNVINMSGAFSAALVFNQPLSNWDTSKVTNMNLLFSNAELFDQPIGNWDTALVTTMSNMFTNSEKFNQPIGNWDTSKVTDMTSMFYGAQAFNQPIGNWDTSKVTNMLYMFTGAQIFNQPLGSWDTSKVTDMRHMFKNASKFDQDLGLWNLKLVTQIDNMLDFSGLKCSNYNSTLQGWANNALTPNNLTLGASGLKYSTAQAAAARNTLASTKGWSIVNDTYDPECNILATSEVNKKKLSIYPNPVKNTLFFSEYLQDITLYSLYGKLLKRYLKGNHINVSELSKGMYILKAIDHSGNSISQKFIKE